MLTSQDRKKNEEKVGFFKIDVNRKILIIVVSVCIHELYVCVYEREKETKKERKKEIKRETLLKKCWRYSFARLMHSCSKLFTAKHSNPKISRIPT